MVIGVLVMGMAVPIILFFLLGLHTLPQLLTMVAVTVLAWGVSDLLSSLLERPRLSDRSPAKALKEDWERRAKDN